MKKNTILYILLTLFVFSCKPRENFDYLKNIEDVAIQTSAQKQHNTIQIGDQIVILVTAKDMDVVKPFNQNYSSSETVLQNNLSGGNTPNTGIQVTNGPTYIVDENGDIDFAIIGKINT